MDTFIQQLVNGLSIGAIYALVAVGYSLVYSVLGLINFAHGHVYMVGTFATLGLILAGAPFGVAVVGGVLVGAVLGLVIERVAYRPLRGANRIAPTVSAVGAALVLENAALEIWGPRTRTFPNPLPSGTFKLGGATVADLSVVVLVTATLLAIALFGAVRFTGWGRTVRAICDDLPTAELMGLHVNPIVASVYAVGSMLGVVGGVLFAAYYNTVYVGMGFTGTINAFTAAVIGGIGDIRGAFVGGLALGVLQAFAVFQIGSGYQASVTFAVLIALLVVRPHGLFGSPAVNRA